MKATGQDTAEQETRTKQLAQEIIEYSSLNRFGPGNVLVDVRDAAFRLRETPSDVRRALYLLEIDGTAERIESDDLWRLRVSKKSKPRQFGRQFKAS